VSIQRVPPGGTRPDHLVGSADGRKVVDGMDVVFDRVAGLDIGKASMTGLRLSS
jgi:hypothetical protein